MALPEYHKTETGTQKERFMRQKECESQGYLYNPYSGNTSPIQHNSGAKSQNSGLIFNKMAPSLDVVGRYDSHMSGGISGSNVKPGQVISNSEWTHHKRAAPGGLDEIEPIPEVECS